MIIFCRHTTAQLLSLPNSASLTPLQMLFPRALPNKHSARRSPLRVLFQRTWLSTVIVMTIMSYYHHIIKALLACLVP